MELWWGRLTFSDREHWVWKCHQYGRVQNWEEANKEQFENLPDEAKEFYNDLNSQITGMEGHEKDIVRDLVTCIAENAPT